MDRMKGSHHKKEKKNGTNKGADTLVEEKECVREYRWGSLNRYQRTNYLHVGWMNRGSHGERFVSEGDVLAEMGDRWMGMSDAGLHPEADYIGPSCLLLQQRTSVRFSWACSPSWVGSPWGFPVQGLLPSSFYLCVFRAGSFGVSMVSPCQHLLNPFLFATGRYHGSPLTVKAKLLFFLWAYIWEIQSMILLPSLASLVTITDRLCSLFGIWWV